MLSMVPPHLRAGATVYLLDPATGCVPDRNALTVSFLSILGWPKDAPVRSLEIENHRDNSKLGRNMTPITTGREHNKSRENNKEGAFYSGQTSSTLRPATTEILTIDDST